MVQQRMQSSRTTLAGRGVDDTAARRLLPPAGLDVGSRATSPERVRELHARGRDVLTAGDMVVLPEVSINPQYGVRGGAPRNRAWPAEDFRGFPGDTAEIGVDMPLLRAVAGSNGRPDVEAGLGAGAVGSAVSDVDAA